MIDELTEERSELEHKLLRAQAQIDSLRDTLQKTRSKLERSIPVPETAAIDATQAEVMMSIAQELRTPMQSIVGYVDLLLSESVGGLGILQRQFLGRVKANADRLDNLLEDFIKITAIDTGEFHLEPIPVNMIEVVDDAITTTRTQFKEKGITLRIDMPDEVPPLIGDRDALQQVVIQLLSNAYLATRTDGEVGIALQNVTAYPIPGRAPKASAHPDPEGPDGTPEPTPGAIETMDGMLLSVHDQGPGIAPDDQSRVFSRLYRADNPLILGLGDTGVGLSIARALVEMHHGRIWLESRPGAGATFKLLLPMNANPAQTVTSPVDAGMGKGEENA
jgi:signal transduction histidine kinase